MLDFIMSLASYRRNEARRVTGPQLPTCFPAALEQISPHHSYRPSVYRDYRDFDHWYGSFVLGHRDERDPLYLNTYTAMIDSLVGPLGGLTCQDVVFKRANTPLGLVRIVKAFMRDGYRVAVDLEAVSDGRDTVHSVGLLPTGEENYVTLVSTHAPRSLQGVVSLHQVAAHLALPDGRYIPEYPFNNSNVTALPPAP